MTQNNTQKHIAQNHLKHITTQQLYVTFCYVQYNSILGPSTDEHLTKTKQLSLIYQLHFGCYYFGTFQDEESHILYYCVM